MNKKYYIIGGILVILLIAALGILFAQPSTPRNNGEDVELTWWKTFEDTENVADLIEAYETAHENVTINYVKKDSTSYEHELVNALASGTGPDVFSIHNDWLTKHSDKIAPIPDSVMNLRTYKDSFVDVAVSDFVVDGKIYAVPIAMDVLALYYNKDILGSNSISLPPKTWPELVSDVERVTKVGKNGIFTTSGIAMGTANNVNRAVDLLSLIMLQNGTKFYSDDFSNATFDQNADVPGSQTFNPGAVALAFYTQFANPAIKSYSWNVKSDFSVDAFTQGKVAMMINYQYMQPLIKAKAPTLNWGVASVPQISGDNTKINFANYWGEAISKNSKHQAVAADFLKFISSKQQLNQYYAKHKLVSSRKDILQEQISDPEIGVFAESALTARSVFKKDANVYEGVFLKMINDVVLNNFEPEVALQNAVQQINLDLQR